MRLLAPQFNKSENGSFYWATDYFHPDNTFTMQEFIEKFLPDDFDVILDDGSYVEVKHRTTDTIFALNAKGDGDSFHHCVEWNILQKT